MRPPLLHEQLIRRRRGEDPLRHLTCRLKPAGLEGVEGRRKQKSHRITAGFPGQRLVLVQQSALGVVAMTGGAHAQAQEGCSGAARKTHSSGSSASASSQRAEVRSYLAAEKRQIAPGESDQPAQHLQIVCVAREYRGPVAPFQQRLDLPEHARQKGQLPGER